MELKPKLQARQQLALSPRLYQSLKVLRLSAADLVELIHQELDENPTLELPEPSDFDLDLTEPGQAADMELWRDLIASSRDESSAQRRDPLRPRSATATELAPSPVTLADHLTLQLHLADLPDAQNRAALAIIGSLDDDGYLREPVEEIAATVDRPAGDIEAALAVVQSFDPAGIAARNLQECLEIQLRQLKAGVTAMTIARDYLPLVARNDIKGIARTLKVPAARVERAVALIRSLNPAPGSMFDATPPAAAVIPDVYVATEAGNVHVLANREILPSLHISRLYREIASGAGGKSDAETVKYIKAKIRDASRLIRDIDQRRATVTRVAAAIAESQPDFFERGPDYLRPLSLENIAGRLGVHPSTISRSILGKFMSTPWGIYEFRYFFSAGYAGSGSGGLASTAVKQRLKKLIEEEDHRRPFSDQKLTDLLKKDGIPISRRTVAKYREELAIPPSWDRKQRS